MYAACNGLKQEAMVLPTNGGTGEHHTVTEGHQMCSGLKGGSINMRVLFLASVQCVFYALIV